MGGKLLPGFDVDATPVRVKLILAAHVGHEDLAHGGGIGALVGRTVLSGLVGFAIGNAGGALLESVTELCFIGLHGAARATHGLRVAFHHGLANAMGHEPRNLVSDAEHAVELMRAHPFFGGGEQGRRQQPPVLRHFGTLEQGADADSELIAARRAEIPTRSQGLTIKGIGVIGSSVEAQAVRFGPSILGPRG